MGHRICTWWWGEWEGTGCTSETAAIGRHSSPWMKSKQSSAENCVQRCVPWKAGSHESSCLSARDCQLIVNGMLGRAQKWRQHGRVSKKGPIQHRDLWEALLGLTEAAGTQVKWLHTPSHIDIPGNTRADHLADVGRRQSPLLFAHLSAHPGRHEVQEEVELDDEMDEVWEWDPSGEEEDIDPPRPIGRRPHAENPPVTGARTGGGRLRRHHWCCLVICQPRK